MRKDGKEWNKKFPWQEEAEWQASRTVFLKEVCATITSKYPWDNLPNLFHSRVCQK